MFWLGYLVLLKTALNQQYVPQSYASVMDNSTVEGFQIIGEPPDHLNLSYLGLSAVSENAFINLTNLKTLNLANNRLKRIPSLSYLVNLESLILENNNIECGKFYVGLSKLEILNIAKNPLTFFEPGHFFGLPKSANIWTKGLNLSYISPAMFENLETDEDNQRLALSHKQILNHGNFHFPWSPRKYTIDMKVCIYGGRLTSVDELENSLTLPKGCRRINSDESELIFTDAGIKTFGNEWYQVRDRSVISIVLSYNEITEFSRELLNDLPAGIHKIDLSGNKIEILRKGIIKSSNDIEILDLRYNSIIYIQYGALENLNLRGKLLLDYNYLTNTRFLDSLPPHVQHVSMNYNSITEISSGNFTKFTQFTSLGLVDNEIKELKAYKLHGFFSLTELLLQINELQIIELGAFQGLKNLLFLDLSDNKMSRLDGDIFIGLDKIRYISLYGNNIKGHLGNILAKMPKSLETLSLGANEIRAESAISVPSGLKGNQVSMSLRGLFNFPKLTKLDLNNNSLMDIDADLFEGFKNLRVLSLARNKIKTINKGLMRNLGNLLTLDLSENPITILTNGSLFGLVKNSRTRVIVNRVPIKVIQAGVFDDV